MRMSSYKQCLLSSALGPLGLLHLSPLMALALATPTACALFVSFEHVFYILGVSATISVIVGLNLVNRHNQLLVKNFQHSTYYGTVPCKVVRRESADKDYHKILKKVRQRKLVGKLGTYCFLLLCITVSGLILAPEIRSAAQSVDLVATSNPENIADSDTTALTASVNYTNNPKQQPIWVQSMHKNSISASLSSVEYQSSSDGLYRPDIRLSCENNNYSVSFSVNEILGTDSTRLSLTSDGKYTLEGTWQLSESYYAATAAKPDEVLNMLRSANKITVAYRPFASEAEKVATFDLHGSAKAIGVFKERCLNWRPA